MRKWLILPAGLTVLPIWRERERGLAAGLGLQCVCRDCDIGHIGRAVLLTLGGARCLSMPCMFELRPGGSSPDLPAGHTELSRPGGADSRESRAPCAWPLGMGTLKGSQLQPPLSTCSPPPPPTHTPNVSAGLAYNFQWHSEILSRMLHILTAITRMRNQKRIGVLP